MSIKLPKVSVIILANRESHHLLETLESVRRQSFKDFDISICCEDNSSNSGRWDEKLQNSSVKLFQQANLNSTQILNLAIAETKGEYIALLKEGDLWHPHKLEKQLFYLECYPSLGVIHSWVTQIDRRGKFIGKIVKHQLSGWIELEILQRNQITYSSAVIRRNCLEKVGLFDPRLQTGFDWDMWIRLSRYYEFSAIAESLVGCRQLRDPVGESWLSRETDFQATIEKAYQNVAGNLLSLKHRSYGYASLNLAWQVLHNQNPDPAIADHYCRQALEHYPSLSFSREFIRISVGAIALHCLGRDRYIYLDSLFKKIHYWQQKTEDKFREFAHLILHWMLQEKEQQQETGRVLRRMRDEG